MSSTISRSAAPQNSAELRRCELDGSGRIQMELPTLASSAKWKGLPMRKYRAQGRVAELLSRSRQHLI
jgi:hypothetical protein